MDLILKDEKYETVKIEDAGTVALENSAMRVVFENGEMKIDDDLEAIRKRASENFVRKDLPVIKSKIH